MNFYWHFIHCYSQIAALLMNLIKESRNDKKSESFDFSLSIREVFIKLWDTFTYASILIYYDSVLHIWVETDASIIDIADILSQLLLNAEWHSVAYWSQKLISAETRYETHDQELLIIVKTFKHWCHYLKGSMHTVEVLTDHNNLQRFIKVKQLNKKQAQWAM